VVKQLSQVTELLGSDILTKRESAKGRAPAVQAAAPAVIVRVRSAALLYAHCFLFASSRARRDTCAPRSREAEWLVKIKRM